MIAACHSDGNVDLVMPNVDDSFSNITVGLGPDISDKDWRILAVAADDYDAFVLCTDGISGDLLPERAREFATEVHKHYRHMPRKERRHDICGWLEAWPVPGHTDDKTIACLYRNGESNERQL